MANSRQSGKKSPERLIALTVMVTVLELRALSRAVVVVTSPFDVPMTRAAERGLRKLWDVARKHPEVRP